MIDQNRRGFHITNKTHKIEFVSKFDGRKFKIRATKHFKRFYKEFGGKCFSVLCNNSAVYLHMTRTGKVDCAYCFHLQADKQRIEEGRKYGGKWFMIYRKKMEEFK